MNSRQNGGLDGDTTGQVAQRFFISNPRHRTLGIMPGTDGWVSLGIRPETKERLEKRGNVTDSFDDVVNRLLDKTTDVDRGDS